MKKKLTVVLCVLLCLMCGVSVAVVSADTALSQADTALSQNASATNIEHEYFGKWNGKTWVIDGKLNYGVPGMKTIENAVKLGDYASAKNLLFTYYKNRDALKGLDIATANRADITLSDLTCRDIILAGSAGTYVRFLDVETTDKWNAFDVSGSFTVGGQVVFTLIAGGKKDNIVTFDSKEGTNRPYLELQMNGQNNIIYPMKDTYIRAGKYDTVNYGNEKVLEINDTGFPYDDNTRRTTLVFDLSKFNGTVSGGKIMLYGSAEKEMCEVMVFKTSNTAWDEKALTWKSETSNIFSWETSPEGTDWRQPASGSMAQFDNTIGGLGHITKLLGAHKATKDDKYIHKAVDMILDFIKDTNGNFKYPDSLRLGQRQRGLPTFLNYLLKTNALDAESFFTIMHFMWQQNNFLGNPLLEYPKYEAVHANASFVTTSNWGMIQNNGFFVGTYFMPELKQFTAWSELTQNRIVQLIDALINADGSYNEDNTSYPLATLGSYSTVINFAVANEIPLSERVIKRMRDWAMWIVDFSLPNGYSPNYGDGGTNSNRPSIANLARLLNDPELIYFSTGGLEGTVPAHNSALYPDMKTAIMRSGWQSKDMYMHINTMQGTHCHTDVNAVIMYAYGQRLLPDTGTKSYDKADPISNWQLTSNESHSTFRLDNTDADRGGDFYNEVQSWHTGDGADVYRGYTEMYADAPHTRTVLMIKPNFYIVADYADNLAAKSRNYELNWQLLPGASPTVDPVTKKAVTNFSSGANLQIIPANHNVTASIKEGYLTNGSGLTQNNNFIKYNLESQDDFSMLTLLYPTYEGQTKGVAATELNTGSKVYSAMRIDFDATMNNDKAYFYVSNEKTPSKRTVTDANVSYNSDAVLFYHQNGQDGSNSRLMLSGGKTLSRMGRVLFESPRNVPSVDADYKGSTLVMSGDIVPCTDKTRAIKIYAPGIESVQVNGKSVAFEMEDDYIYAAESNDESEAARLDALIAELPSVDKLTADYKDRLVEIRNEVRLFTLKGLSTSTVSKYADLVNAEKRVATLLLLQDYFVRMEFLPDIADLELGHVEQVASLRDMLNQIIAETGEDPSVFKEYSDILDRYEKVTGSFYDRKGMLLKSNSMDDYTIIQNGKDYWWYYYQVARDPDAQKVGTLTEMTPHPGSCWADVVSLSPRNTSDYMIPSIEKSSLRMWKAPCAGTVKVKITVGAYYNMTGSNGVMSVVSVNELPFINDGTTVAKVNPNAVFKQHIDALDPENPQPVYYTYEGVFALDKDGYVVVGVDAEGLSAYDRMYVNMDVEFLTNIKTNSAQVFNRYADLLGRIDDLPSGDKISLENKEEVEKLVAETEAFGRENLANIDKLDSAANALKDLSAVGYAIQPFVEGEGEIVLSKTEANKGEFVSFLLKPAPGYRYKEGSLKINGVPYDALTFIMPESFTSVSCEFEKIQYNIISTGYERGKFVSGSPTASVGERVYFTIVPEYGYVLENGEVKVNGVVVTGDWFIMPEGEVIVEYRMVEKAIKNNGTVAIVVSVSVAAVAVAGGLTAFFLLRKRRKAHAEKLGSEGE